MNRDGIPLPSALSGNIIERLVRVDEALFYLILGAMAELTDDWFLEQTGALTVEDAKIALMEMMWCLQEDCSVLPIGWISMFPTNAIPDKWLLCDGQTVSRTVYAELFALLGTIYGAGNGTTTFNLPSFPDRSPMGIGTIVTAVGNQAGNSVVTLNLTQIPSHNHTITDPGHVHTVSDAGHTHQQRQFAGADTYVAGAAGGANPTIANGTNTTNTVKMQTGLNSGTGIGVVNHATGISLAAAGGGASHNNVSPVLGVNFIIYAGV